MAIRVLLVDDHKILRQGIETMLKAEGPDQFDVVGQAGDGWLAVQQARDLQPDVVVLDLGLPGLNGVDAARRILAESPRTRIIGFSMYSSQKFVTEALEVGMAGYLLKDCAMDHLVEAIHSVLAGDVYLSPRVAETVVSGYLSKDRGGAGGARLSPREREVLQLLAEGLNTREIAEKLHVSAKTVETHRRQIMMKLDIHNVAQLTKYAIRHGLTEC